MSQTDIVSLQGVDVRFGDFTALRDLTLDIREGEFFSLLGPSGCGKTTALRVMAGFQSVSAGRLLIDGCDSGALPANRRPTNMVFQNYAIFPHLNVADNVAFGLKSLKLPASELRARVAAALEQVDLGGFDRRRSAELSGGQRQRVALARALILQPRVLLLDEPLSALDRQLRENMQWELRDLQRRVGITFVMVTHDQYEAMSMSDRIGVMFDGQLHQVASPSSLYASPCNRRVAAFIGGMNFFDATVSSGTVAVAGATVPVPRDWADGPCTLGIRPEQLQLDDAARNNWDLSVRGTVRDCSFYGESVHYRVDVAGSDHPWTVAQTNYFGRRDHAPGDSVYVGCQQAALINLGND